MTLRLTFLSLALLGVCVTPAAADAPIRDCQNDVKLIGLIELSTADTPSDPDATATWWGITKAGLIAEGFDTEAEQIAVTAAIFGLDPADLTFEEAKELIIAGVTILDRNENGFVCATIVPARSVGTGGVPAYFFGATDDRDAGTRG